MEKRVNMLEIDIEKRLDGAFVEAMGLSLSLQIKQGEFVALTGKSGSGKTTFLRILAGLEEAKGTIKVGEKIWQDKYRKLSIQKREIGFVFQDYALFENMSVEENLLYVQKDKKLAHHLLEMTDLLHLKKRYPKTLSGGQKQRVSLCRAMMKKPKLLLLDEPLSALDFAMRTKLQQEILLLHKEFQTNTIMVSHDSSEIYRLANRVIVLDQGKIVANGTPRDILLQTKQGINGSFEGELLEIRQADILFVAVIAIGQQLVEVVIDKEQKDILQIGQKISVSMGAFHLQIM